MLIAVHQGATASKQPPMPATGRHAGIARYHDRLMGLSIFRLRKFYSARQVMQLLEEHYSSAAYSNRKNLDRARDKARRNLLAFMFQAKYMATCGQWFPPFGRFLVY